MVPYCPTMDVLSNAQHSITRAPAIFRNWSELTFSAAGGRAHPLACGNSCGTFANRKSSEDHQTQGLHHECILAVPDTLYSRPASDLAVLRVRLPQRRQRTATIQARH